MGKKPSIRHIINPLTGRKIQVGGTVHKQLIGAGILTQRGGTAVPPVPARTPVAVKQARQKAEIAALPQLDGTVLRQQSDKFFDDLVKKATTSTTKPIPTKLAATIEDETPIVPKNKFALIGSNLPPAPAQNHSYYHHHAPFAQDFGSYVCLKKETLRDLAMFFRDSMFTSVDHASGE